MSTNSWIAHRALLAPSSVKRHKVAENLSLDCKNIVKYESHIHDSHNKPSFYNLSDNYDPRYPNEYEKAIKSILIKPLIIPSISENITIEQPKLSGDEMLKRRLDALEAMDNNEATKEEEKKKIGIKLLTKMGWKEGEGLGKHHQGMTTPLMVKNITSKTGIIVNAEKIPSSTIKKPQLQNLEAVKADIDLNIAKSRVITLSLPVTQIQDMDELEDATSQFGSLINIKIVTSGEYNSKCNTEGSGPDDHLKVLCEYETEDQATKAYIGLNGSILFNSRISASFLIEDLYNLFPN